MKMYLWWGSMVTQRVAGRFIVPHSYLNWFIFVDFLMQFLCVCGLSLSFPLFY